MSGNALYLSFNYFFLGQCKYLISVMTVDYFYHLFAIAHF